VAKDTPLLVGNAEYITNGTTHCYREQIFMAKPILPMSAELPPREAVSRGK
jgi:hypothetical protein